MEFMINGEEIDIDDQPMPEVDEKTKEDLRTSIRKYGIEYPLVVYRKENGRYSLIDGRTRFTIGTEEGIKQFRCIVEDVASKPERQILKYDLELYRRRLQKDQVERLTKEKEAFADELFTNEKCLSEQFDRIIPEYRERMRNHYKINKEEALIMLRDLLDIPPEHQKMLLIAESQSDGNEDLKILVTERENLSVKVEELTQEVDRLKDVEEKLAEKQKQMDTVMTEYKKRFNDELSERQKEIENNLRELYAEQDATATAQKIEAAVSAERIRLENEMASEIEDLNREMREMSLSIKKTNEEIDKKKEELDKVKEKLKEAQDIVVRKESEVRSYRDQLKNMTSPKNVELKVRAASDSLSTILEMVQVAQNEMLSCLDILNKNGVEKPKLTPILNEIEEKKKKIEGFLSHIGKAREKLQAAIKN